MTAASPDHLVPADPHTYPEACADRPRTPRHHPLRYAAFDLDGTLLDRRGRFLPGLADGLTRLRDQGVRPLLVTGRSLSSFRGISPTDPVLTAFDDPLLLSHGNVLLRRTEGLITVTRALPEGIALRLAAAGLPDTVTETGDALVARTRRAALAYSLAYDLPRSAVATEPAGPAKGESAAAVTVFGAAAGLSGLSGKLAGLSHDLDRISAFQGCVVRPEGTCKAAALDAHLRETYGEEQGLSAVIAFGDSRNDGCLLGSAAYGVAVEGSDEIAVRHCDQLLTGPLADFLATFDAHRRLPQASVTAHTTARPPCFGAHAAGAAEKPVGTPSATGRSGR
ncbi:HAD family hydrolase [Streptomyces sp. NPDC001890]|uniref:HAD family hydrolase n=1 Tax=Streptomyces sp. NPDC001890 TaxID=3364620 RepID=UPI00367386F5